MVEDITFVLGPIFHNNSDYKTIQEAMALVVARIAQATPDKGNEEAELETIMEIAADALNQFINEEKSIQEAKQKVLDKGIGGFAELYGTKTAVNNGSLSSATNNTEEANLADQKEAFESELARQDNPDGPRAYLPG